MVMKFTESKRNYKGELNITEGALYPALHKLEADGLLDVEVEKSRQSLKKILQTY